MKNSLSLVKGKLLRQNSGQTQKLLLSVAGNGDSQKAQCVVTDKRQSHL